MNHVVCWALLQPQRGPPFAGCAAWACGQCSRPTTSGSSWWATCSARWRGGWTSLSHSGHTCHSSWFRIPKYCRLALLCQVRESSVLMVGLSFTDLAVGDCGQAGSTPGAARASGRPSSVDPGPWWGGVSLLLEWTRRACRLTSQQEESERLSPKFHHPAASDRKERESGHSPCAVTQPPGEPQLVIIWVPVQEGRGTELWKPPNQLSVSGLLPGLR